MREIVLNKIIKKTSGMMIIFAILVVWAFFSYNKNVSTMQTSSGVVSRKQDRLGSQKSR